MKVTISNTDFVQLNSLAAVQKYSHIKVFERASPFDLIIGHGCQTIHYFGTLFPLNCYVLAWLLFIVILVSLVPEGLVRAEQILSVAWFPEAACCSLNCQ